MEGGGHNPAVNPGDGGDGELASSAPARVASHDPGSGSGRAGNIAESLADMKKRRKE
jgi:hypothetical protein